MALGGPKAIKARRDNQKAPEITRTSPPWKRESQERENHEKYSAEVSAAIRTS